MYPFMEMELRVLHLLWKIVNILFSKAVERGAKVVKEPETIKDDDGEVILASVQTYNETIHTFVERKNYNGLFLPGFVKHPLKEVFNVEGEEV